MRVPRFRLRGDEDIRWMDDAACRGKPHRWFFPDLGNDAYKVRALAVCSVCPVQAPCLEFALAHDEPGIWGNRTSTERAFIRQARRRRNA